MFVTTFKDLLPISCERGKTSQTNYNNDKTKILEIMQAREKGLRIQKEFKLYLLLYSEKKNIVKQCMCLLYNCTQMVIRSQGM